MYIKAFNGIRAMSNSSGIKLGFSTENISEAVGMLGKGMLGIFVALTIIYIACIALQKLFPPKDDE